MSNRHTAIRVSVSALLAIVGLSISMLSYAQSEETQHEAAGNGTIIIEQKNLSDDNMLGTLTLIKPGNEEYVDSNASATLSGTPTGSYTLFAEGPEGTTTIIRIYKDGVLTETLSRPQYTFKLTNGQTVRLSVNYTLTQAGVISVQSDPSGIQFELTGPNGIIEAGSTPGEFLNMPIGLYKVQYIAPEGCGKPAPKSGQMVDQGRLSFDITIACEIADILRNREETKDDKYVVVEIDNQDVTLYDVPQNSWFATFVHNAARRNVLAGYKDESGKPTGQFGPGNNVTIAELAKIAHRLGGISEEAFIGKNPENQRALGQWFSPFIASAESRGWAVFQDITIDPLRPATRAEVIATFMQVSDVSLPWQKGQLFSDVTVRTRFASSIEKAAADGIVDGRMDENGKPLHLFAPQDPVNRAEIAKMINKIFEVYKGVEEDDL